MESDARKAFNPAYGKIQSGMKSHDTSKFKEAAELIWKVMDERQYDEIFEVNNFYAYACMLSEEYRESAIAFSYANDFRNAFRAAYEGAEKKDDIELYALAAAFASIYITETEDGVSHNILVSRVNVKVNCAAIDFLLLMGRRGFHYSILLLRFQATANCQSLQISYYHIQHLMS